MENSVQLCHGNTCVKASGKYADQLLGGLLAIALIVAALYALSK